MLNEGKYRSPEWLRKWLDFEINTGEDVKGEKSKKQIRKDKESAEKRNLKEWDNKWEDADQSLFNKFYSVVYKNYRDNNDANNFRYSIYSTELDTIKAKFRGDMSFWTKYDNWVKTERVTAQQRVERERQAEEKQQKIHRDLEKLYDDIITDWKSARYTDKIKTPKVAGKTHVHYTMENGDTIKQHDDKLEIGGIIYTLGLDWRNKFISLFNAIIENANEQGKRRAAGGSGGSERTGGYWNTGSGGSGRKTHSGSGSGTKKNWSGHPKGNLYQTLLDTIKSREDQLRKMSRNDSERMGLENELAAAKRRAAALKKKYKFEHIIHNFDVWLR